MKKVSWLIDDSCVLSCRLDTLNCDSSLPEDMESNLQPTNYVVTALTAISHDCNTVFGANKIFPTIW